MQTSLFTRQVNQSYAGLCFAVYSEKSAHFSYTVSKMSILSLMPEQVNQVALWIGQIEGCGFFFRLDQHLRERNPLVLNPGSGSLVMNSTLLP